MRKIYKNINLIILILLGVMPLIWYLGKGDVIINGIDTNFPLDPLAWFKRRFFVWDSVINLGRDFSSSTSGFFFHLIQVIPFILGFNLQITQIISVIFWFSLVVFSAFTFARVFIGKNKLAQIVFVFLYSLNIYLFNTWENIKVANLALVISIPLFLSILKLFKERKIDTKKLILFSALSSIVSFGSGINPAYFVVLFLSIVLYSLIVNVVKKGSFKLIWKGPLISLLVLVLCNLFWILPLLNFLFISNKPGSVEDLGFSNWIHSLSANTSLVNVFRLQGAWDWYTRDEAGFPLYIPYALNYFKRASFILFSFLTPAFSILSLIFQNKKEKSIYLFFAILILLSLFLGAGSHPPTGAVFLYLYERVPFFNFFRSPWYIFTPWLTLSLSALTALFVKRVQDFFEGKSIFKNFKYQHIITGFVFIFLFGHTLYSYPLITGKIFRPGRSDSFYSKFPGYVWDAEEWLDKNAISSRIITYPDDDVETFNWGYRGTESILGLYSNKEYISPSFNIENNSFKALLSRLYTYFKSGRYNSALSLFRFFGADTLFVKEDANTHSPKLNIERLSTLGDLTKIGEWSFIEFDLNNKKIYSPQTVFMNETAEKPDSFSVFADVLPQNSAVVDHRDNEVKKVPQFREDTLRVIELTNLTVKNNPISRVQEYEFEVQKEGKYDLIIEKKGFNMVDILIDSPTISLSDLDAQDTEDKAIFKSINIKKGKHKITITYPETEDMLKIEDYSSFYSVPELRDEELSVDVTKTFVVKAGDEGMKIEIPVANFNPFINYRLTFDHKFFYGHSPIVDAIQYVPETPLKAFATDAGASFDWERKFLDIFPAEINSDLKIVIRIPVVNKDDKSRSFIENMRLFRTYDNRVFLLEEGENKEISSPQNITFKKINPTKYEVTTEGITDDYVLVFLESYNPGWELSSKDFLGKPIHFSINGYANAWYIPSSLNTQNMVLSYKPQKMYLYGLTVSIGTIIACVIFQTKYGEKIWNILKKKK